jgi:hypothetical protein
MGGSLTVAAAARQRCPALPDRAIEHEVELDDVDAMLAQQSERAALGVLVDQGAHRFRRDPTRPGCPALVDGVKPKGVKVRHDRRKDGY